MTELQLLSGHSCLVVGDDDPLVRNVAAGTDLVGAALSDGAGVIVVPTSRLDQSFFDLRSGLAGEILQKAVNYRIRFAVIGDVSEYAAASKAFHDLVVESQRSRDYFFVSDLAALAERLDGLSPGG